MTVAWREQAVCSFFLIDLWPTFNLLRLRPLVSILSALNVVKGAWHVVEIRTFSLELCFFIRQCLCCCQAGGGSDFHAHTFKQSYMLHSDTITHRSHRNMLCYQQRDTPMGINIECCLSNFQVARPHAALCIKENIHLKVDFWRSFWGAKQRGVCWFKSIQMEPSSLIGRDGLAVFRSYPPGLQRQRVQGRTTTGLACCMQMGQYDGNDKF